MKIGIGQINTTVGDLSGNRARILDYAQKSDQAGVDLLVFPELAITGYPIMDLAFKKDFVKAAYKELEHIVEWSKGRSMCLAIGMLEKPDRAERKGYNSLVFIQDGRILAQQRKSLLPTYDVFVEEMFFKKGSEFPTLEVAGWKIGGTVCEDIWDESYELKPLDHLKEQGVQLVANASASPFHVGKIKERENLVVGQARKHGMALVFANLVGGQDDLIFDGRSMIVDASGKLLARGASFKEDLVIAEIESLEGDASSPTTWETSDEEMYDALCLGIRDYVRKNNFLQVVIGLSGGMDSSLVAVLAADALGPDKVVGVSMPGPYSRPESFEDAQDLARNLGIRFQVHSIRSRYFSQKAEFEKKAQIEPFLRSSELWRRGVGRIMNLKPRWLMAGHKTTLASENLQARLRGETLMYLSNSEGYLVLSTGNKSELAMGYCTLYGDMCGGLSVLADVYKTEVWQLARYRNQKGFVIPKRVITRPPSAELRPNQTDQDSLPPYERLDRVLRQYIEEDRDVDEIVNGLKEEGISEEGLADQVREIIQKTDRNEYKRRQGAPTLRVSSKAWTGRRMPITNKFNQTITD